MKILFLTRLFYPHSGGVEKHVLKLSSELQKLGHEISVVTEMHSKNLMQFEIHEKINIYRIPINTNEKSKKFTIWKWIIHNRRFINKFDVVHAHDVFYWALPLKIISPGLKMYTTFHGYEGNKTPNSNSKFMHRLADRLSEKTISIGGFYEKWYGVKSDIISYGAVDPVYKNISLKCKNISYVGRLEDEAGILDYIDAFKLIYKTSNLKLDVYGDGTKRQNITRQMNKYHLPIILHGWVDSPEEKIINSSIIFTSRYLGILESLAQGKFVIAVYNSRIKKDYLINTPFAKYISIVSTPKEIANEVTRFLLTPKIYEQKLNKAQKWATQQTWNRLAKQYLRLWN